MDKLSLMRRVDNAALSNITTGLQLASALSLFLLVMVVISVGSELWRFAHPYFVFLLVLLGICAGVFILGLQAKQLKKIKPYWKIATTAYGAAFSVSWASLILYLSDQPRFFAAADILTDLMLMIVLLAFFAYRPMLYTCVTPLLVITTWIGFDKMDTFYVLPIEKFVAICIIIESGRHVLYRWFINNIEKEHENQRLMKQLAELASKDQLTDIHNRRYFEYELNKQCNIAKRQSSELGLIMLDIDHFKDYNDKLGHPQGDKCLKDVAQVIQQSLMRTTDSVSRYGGEEFVVLLPCTDIEGTILVAERIKQNLTNAALLHPNSATSEWVTVSQGIAQWLDHTGPESLLEEADQHLYQAKAAGRNQYCYKAA
ncbi:hypothetical protein A3K86_15200 [Photobacterium jeanii]|uniref:diguanylate cyclase n=1 Tax=Photobacterium jeanii TaxID=858640 RepID=A0A178K8M3_9GAMM|nr:GGDEF domain-containing protein [Photobacterium jeanii]OAN13013.1 hypothetical protein A3K86_15200 [Photobacterium jeanii]PST89161.1 GGDEF domain-containing protein [Photobacterium jeanii]